MRRTKPSSPTEGLLCCSFCHQRLNGLAIFPFLRGERLDVKLITGAGIRVPAHASDGIHKLLVDMQVRRVDRVAAHEHANDFTENDLTGRTDLKRRMATAFQSRRSGQNTGLRTI